MFSRVSCQVLSALEVSLCSSRLAGLFPPLNGSSSVAEHAGGRKRGKVAELLRKVKNLFLQSDLFSSANAGKLQTAFRYLELTAEHRFPQSIPETLRNLQPVWRHLLEKPTRTERFFARTQLRHARVER